MTLNLNGKNIAEWTVDIAITAASAFIAGKFFLTAGVPAGDQLANTLIVIGLSAAAFKAARNWKAFK